MSDISKINIENKEYKLKDAEGRARIEEAVAETELAAKNYTNAQLNALKGAVSADFNTLEKIEDKIEELDSSVDERFSNLNESLDTSFDGIDEQIGSTNAKVSQVETTANNALALAQSKNLNKVFETTSAMYTWLANAANKGQLQVGSALYIKEVDVPDWWITEVLNAPNADGRYYNIAPLEAEGAGGAAGSTVSVQQTLTSGTEIGSITVDGTPTKLYAPEAQNAFGNVVVGSTTIAADSKTDSLTLVAGDNVTITPDATNDKITIAATDTKYTLDNITGTLAVAKGGTGATDAATARTNLGLDTAATYAATTSIENGGTGLITSGAVYTGLSGKAPTAHATTALTYGGGTASNYGHVKLSDSYTTSAGAASASVAASSKAVADAYAEINSNLNTLNSRFDWYYLNSDTTTNKYITTNTLKNDSLYLMVIQESSLITERSVPSFAIVYINNGMWINLQKSSESKISDVTYNNGKITVTVSEKRFIYICMLNLS